MARKGVDLYNIKSDPESILEALRDLRQDFDSHNHDGSSARSFETLILETLRARAISIKKGAYSDSTGGLWEGIDSGILKMNIGDATNYMKWSGTALTIVGTIQTSETGERIVFDAPNDNLDMINSSGNTVAQFNYGTLSEDAILTISPQNDSRKGIKVVTASGVSGANPSIHIDCDATDDAVFALDIDRDGNDANPIYGMTVNAANAGAGSATGVDINAPTGIRMTGISVSGMNISTTANGITITQSGSSSNHSVLITNTSSDISSWGMYIDRDINQAGTAYGLIVACDNATGAATGIDVNCSGGAATIARGIRIAGSPEHGIQLTGCGQVFEVDTDNTDPTGGGGAATGRIPIDVGGATKYIPYY